MNTELTCLLIDDDKEDHEIFDLAIAQTQLPIKCKMVNSTDEALTLLQNQEYRPDFIFIDVNMPRKGGKECISELRKIESLKDSMLIAISTFTSERDVNELKKLGANRYIAKPSNIEIFNKILSDCFREKVTLQTS